MLIYIGMYGRKFFLFCDIEVYTFFKIIGQIGQIPLENIRLCVPSFEHGGGEGCNSADKKPAMSRRLEAPDGSLVRMWGCSGEGHTHLRESLSL